MAVTDSPGAGRVFVALSDGPLVAEPTWTRFDNITNCRLYGYDTYAGRQSELDTTDTGTATAWFYDTSGTLDDDGLIGLQILFQLYNPVTDAWHIRWRGHIDDIEHDLVDTPPSITLANVAVRCVGIFDYLGGCRMLPGIFGNDVVNGSVLYEENDVQSRVSQLFSDALLAPSMHVEFTGNVDVIDTLYDPEGDVVLMALRDACDAEFPSGVSNVYEDRFGRAVWHGRKARIDPETTAASASDWDFHRWYAATREDVVTDVAQIREFAFNRPRSRIINSYLAYPRADENGVQFDRANIPDLLVKDDTSIAAYGYRGADAPDLIIKQNFNNSETGAEQCVKFGQFFTTNYGNPKKAVERVVFKSHDPGDARAAATYALMCQADVSDAINLTIDEANLSDEPFFIDGVAIECRPANEGYDYITMTPNLTPASYFDTEIFDDA